MVSVKKQVSRRRAIASLDVKNLVAGSRRVPIIMPADLKVNIAATNLA
jgi:hypothetical protein